MMTRFEGYLLIPHELLHMMGYRLVGKQCRYRWGDKQVKPIGPMTRTERLVGLLSPFVVCSVTGLSLLLLAGGAFFLGSITWGVLLILLAGLTFLYASASIGDLRQAYLLLREKKSDQKTPFDFLFWPVLKEHQGNVQISAVVVLIGLILIYTLYLLFFG